MKTRILPILLLALLLALVLCGCPSGDSSDMPDRSADVQEPPEAETPEEPEAQKPEKKSGGSAALVILLLLAGGGGAAYYFLKVKGKAKPQTKGDTDLEDYEYGVEDEEYEFEPYQPEAEGGAPGETEDEDS